MYRKNVKIFSQITGAKSIITIKRFIILLFIKRGRERKRTKKLQGNFVMTDNNRSLIKPLQIFLPKNMDEEWK
jgi:hypothetical protein